MKCSKSATWLLFSLLSACSTPNSRIDRLYTELRSDAAEHPTGSRPDPKLDERHASRAAEVREIIAKDGVKDRATRLHAAVLLAETTNPDDLALAEKIARQVGLDGDKLGFRVAAEAVDKQLVLRRLPQRYGTQYEWVPVLGEWRLYPIDATTTDDDRRAMEVAPLVELYDGEKKMNAGRRK